MENLGKKIHFLAGDHLHQDGPSMMALFDTCPVLQVAMTQWWYSIIDRAFDLRDENLGFILSIADRMQEPGYALTPSLRVNKEQTPGVYVCEFGHADRPILVANSVLNTGHPDFNLLDFRHWRKPNEQVGIFNTLPLHLSPSAISESLWLKIIKLTE